MCRHLIYRLISYGLCNFPYREKVCGRVHYKSFSLLNLRHPSNNFWTLPNRARGCSFCRGNYQIVSRKIPKEAQDWKVSFKNCSSSVYLTYLEKKGSNKQKKTAKCQFYVNLLLEKLLLNIFCSNECNVRQ